MVRVIFGGQVCLLNKDLLNSEPLLCNPGYTPDKVVSVLIKIL